ncbi:hypothetical protein MFUL124B02_04220 [Myxococcus fulvus 124B02]|nr:hypothetical protein MFUL124B02_04220 [Myxococcus fulvus 124B02]
MGGILPGCGEEPPAPVPPEEVTQGQQLPTLMSCPVGSTMNRYSPPLSMVPRDTTVTGTSTFSNCVSLSGEVTSGELSFYVELPGFSCQDLLEVGSARADITWNTGETSTLLQTRGSVQVSNATVVLTYVGTVESGKFQGATAIRTLTYFDVNLFDCFSSRGVPGLSGVTTLTLLGLP